MKSIAGLLVLAAIAAAYPPYEGMREDYYGSPRASTYRDFYPYRNPYPNYRAPNPYPYREPYPYQDMGRNSGYRDRYPYQGMEALR